MKKVCNRCGAEDNLHIHHKNRNHYDNRPRNREVLCRSCHAQEHWNDPEFHEELTKMRRTKKAREENSRRVKALWANPEYRNKVVAAKTAPKVIKRLQRAAKVQWKNPAIRAKMIEARSKTMKALWKDPIISLRMLAGRKRRAN